MKEKRGGKPFGSKIYKLGLTGCDPREAKDKGRHCLPGRKGGRGYNDQVTASRSGW